MPIPGFYDWEVPGKSILIQLSLDVVDRLQQDVIRGFGAVPRRGAEVGGVLLGTIESDGPVVRVDEYELVPIEYKRGPSYLLSAEDVEAFEAALAQLRGEEKALRPIGYFRSHTRDGDGLGDEDLALLAKYFEEPETVALLIRPFGTKPSIAGFYFKEDGAFQSGPPLREFSFRRKDLAPDDATPPQPPPERPRINISPRREPPRAEPERPAPPVQPSERRTFPSVTFPDPDAAATAEPLDAAGYVPVGPEVKSKARSGWIWLPLSFIFLLMGLLLGFQAALTMRSHGLAGASDAYNISLSVSQSGNDLQLKWDRQSAAIRAAQRGILTIEDGSYHSKPTELAASELQSGSMVVYPHSTNQVRFHLELIMKDRDSLTETVEWKQ